MIDILDRIEFDGVAYPVREVLLKLEEDGEVLGLQVAAASLERALTPFETPEASQIDERIYFYVADEDMSLSQHELTALVARETEAFIPEADELEE